MIDLRWRLNSVDGDVLKFNLPLLVMVVRATVMPVATPAAQRHEDTATKGTGDETEDQHERYQRPWRGAPRDRAHRVETSRNA
jgi:hypothetical protein